MERAFIVTGTKLGNDTIQYEKANEDVKKQVREFFKENEIETKKYIVSPHDSNIGLYPTDKDLEKFEDVLLKKEYGGCRFFRKNCRIQKAWLKRLKDNGIKVLEKPYPAFYLDTFLYKYSSRLFSYKNEVYLTIDTEIKFDIPSDFKEIKMSEFFKVLEEIEEGDKKNE